MCNPHSNTTDELHMNSIISTKLNFMGCICVQCQQLKGRWSAPPLIIRKCLPNLTSFSTLKKIITMSRNRQGDDGAGPSSISALDRVNGHAFLQAMMQRAYMRESDAKELYKKICNQPNGKEPRT